LSDQLTAQFFYAIFKRNGLLFVLTVILFVVMAYAATLYMPKRYKSRAVLEIHSSYFQNPLISDLIPETHDPSELSSQRASLLRRVLTNEFLDDLGTNYGIYSSNTDLKTRAVEREGILKSIETFPLNSTSFQLSVAADDPLKATDLTITVLTHTIDGIVNERHKKMENTRNALNEHIRSLGVALNELTDTQAAKSPQLLKSELEKVNADIEAMLKHYTKLHPEVATRINRAKELERMIGEAPPSSERANQLFLPLEAKEPVKEVYHESLRKLSYLNIALDIEKEGSTNPHISLIEEPGLPTSPFAPNKKLLLLFGLVTGVVIAALLVFIQEMKRGTFLSPEHVSDSLGVPLLGKLPQLEHQPKRLLVYRKIPKALPLLAKEG